MEQAAKLELAAQLLHEQGLHYAALVVSGLVPGIGEEQLQGVDAGIGDHVLQHLDGIMTEQPLV